MVKLFFKETKIKDLDLPYILLGDEKMKNLIFGKFHIWMKYEIYVAYFLFQVSRNTSSLGFRGGDGGALLLGDHR